MDNIFFQLNSLSFLTLSLQEKFLNEKIGFCFNRDNNQINNLLINFAKTNIVDTNSKNFLNDSVKAVVCEGDNLSDDDFVGVSQKKELHVIYNDFEKFLQNKLVESENIYIYLNPLCVVNKTGKIEKIVINFICEILISLQNKCVNKIVNEENIYNENLAINNCLELIIFFEKNNSINIHNYNYFMKLLLPIYFIQKSLKPSIALLTNQFYEEMFIDKMDIKEVSFLLSYIYNKFITSKSFFKTKTECFYEKLNFHKTVLDRFYSRNKIIESYFTVFQNELMVKKFKSKYLDLLKLNNQIFKMVCAIFKKYQNCFNSKINSRKLLQAFSFATDYEVFGIGTMMRNLGYLNAN